MIDKAVDAFERAAATGDLSHVYALGFAPDRAEMILATIRTIRGR